MSEISAYDSIIRSLESYDGRANRLYVYGGQLHNWEDTGIISKIQRFVYSILGSFELHDVSVFIKRNGDQLVERPDLEHKLQGLVDRLDAHKSNSARDVESIIYLFQGVRGPSQLPDVSSDEKNRAILKEKFDQLVNAWSEKGMGRVKKHVENDFSDHLVSLQNGMNLEDIAKKWNEKANQVHKYQKEYAKIFSSNLRDFLGASVVNEMYEDFSNNILPHLLVEEDYTLIEKQVEKAIKNKLKEDLANFRMTYRIEKSSNVLRMSLDEVASEIRKTGLDYFGNDVEEFMKKEFLYVLFDEMSIKYKKKYGNDLDLSLIKLDSFSGYFNWFDVYGVDAKNSIVSDWDRRAEELVKVRNNNFWKGNLFKKFAEQYPFLKLNADSLLNSKLLEIPRKEAFEAAVTEWVKKQAVEMDQSAKEYQEMMIPNYNEFGEVVARTFSPKKLYADTAEEADARHRAALIEIASKQLTEEYGVPLVIDSSVKDTKSFHDMGVAVNLVVLDSLFPSHMDDIVTQLSLHGVEYTTKEVHRKQSRKVFNEAVRLMAASNHLEPEQVLNGQMRFTGYDKDLMKKYISEAARNIHGSVFEKTVGRLFS